MTDYHVHSQYSFDALPDAVIASLPKAALERGVTRLALCDHYDLNCVKDGSNPDIDFAARKGEIDAANASDGRVTILNGVELGQATQEQAMAERLLDSHAFDVVLGSLHNIRGMPDFYFIDYSGYSTSQLEDLYRAYLIELSELAEWGRFHILAHVTYPLRYYAKAGRAIRTVIFADHERRVFDAIIKQGIALEVNTSGLFTPQKRTLPPYSAVERYIAAGGRKIALGSDAHSPGDIGRGFDRVAARLRRSGIDQPMPF